MKIVKNLFLAFFLTLVNGFSVFAVNPTPDPPMTARGTPKPPGANIDQDIMFLLVFALLFGIYVIYRYNLKRKASI